MLQYLGMGLNMQFVAIILGTIPADKVLQI